MATEIGAACIFWSEEPVGQRRDALPRVVWGGWAGAREPQLAAQPGRVPVEYWSWDESWRHVVPAHTPMPKASDDV